MSHSPRDPTNEPPGTGALPEDERHRILAVERRRVLLDVLAERETPIHVEDAAATVAEREGEGGTLDAGTVERVAITLHHAHLPVLAECGIVDYDPDTNWIVSFRDT